MSMRGGHRVVAASTDLHRTELTPVYSSPLVSIRRHFTGFDFKFFLMKRRHMGWVLLKKKKKKKTKTVRFNLGFKSERGINSFLRV